MTLTEALRRAAEEAPAHEAFVYRDGRVTYGDWWRLAERLGAALLACGGRKGDRVALLLPPRPEYPIAYAAAARAGLVAVGINPRLADAEIVHVLEDSAAAFVVAIDRFAGRELAALVAARKEKLPDLSHVLVVEEERVALDPAAVQAAASGDAFASWLAEPSPAARQALDRAEHAIGDDDPAALVYTSGTTGKPKGALFAVRNLAAVAETRGEMGSGRGERMLTGGTPFAHVGFMTKIVGGVLDLHTTVILDAFKARTVLETIARERINYLGGVPAQWSLLLLDPEFERFDLSSLQGGAIGGAPFTPDLVRDIRRRFGIKLVTRYSCTEIALGTGSRPDDSEELLTETVGRPSGEVELRIVDDTRRPLPVGEVGEVAVRSPAVMVGYWRKPDETAAVLDADGWFHTGDLGVLDERGYLRLRGRKKEMYIRGGYNVYPVEVEAVLARHPAVAEVAVVGVPDPVLGEKGLAVVVVREGRPAPSAGELREHCRSEIAHYKMPDFVEVRTELPLNAMYKVDKAALRKAFTDRAAAPS